MVPVLSLLLVITTSTTMIQADQNVTVTPDQCSFSKNDYSIHWFEENGQVFFDLTTKAPNDTNNWWTAVGFGDGHVRE